MRRKNEWGWYDAPLVKDWLFWWSLFMLYVAVQFTMSQGQGIIDGLFNFVVQFVVLVVPLALVRKFMRSNNRARLPHDGYARSPKLPGDHLD